MRLYFHKPSRPYKNFKDFLVQKGQRKGIKYPCTMCYGSKIIIDPSEQPDPVEGHKLSNRIECYLCNGTGSSTLEELRMIYKIDIDNHLKEMNDWKIKTNKLKRALKKITKEELDLIVRAYNHFF